MAAFKKILVFYLMLSSFQLIADEGWQLITEKEGVSIYQKQMAGYPFKHTKGVVTVKANVAMVFALMNDLAACKQWVFGCLEGKRLDDDSIYLVFKGPPLFNDREMILVSKVAYLKNTEQWLITVENVKHDPLNENHVMVRSMQAEWIITTQPNNELTIEHTFYIDPNVSVKWGANRYNGRAIFQTLLKMPKMLQRPKYQKERFLPAFIQQLKD